MYETFAPPHEYIWIRAWGNMMGSQPYYIEGEQSRASQEGAPVTAIYGREGDWQTLLTITGQHARDYLIRWAEHTGNEIPADVLAKWEETKAIGQPYEVSGPEGV